tara:strand:+ start:27 stop:197 length:171 start_codon:yes stop_codon:yes gene_type:complete
LIKAITKHINKKLEEWIRIWNEDVHTDELTSLKPYASGRIDAYKELLLTIKNYEEE